MAFDAGPGKHQHDPNRRTCGDCGRTWFVPCPECGDKAGEDGQVDWVHRPISDRAKRLIEALHEPHGLDKRWEIAESYLAEERIETVGATLGVPRMSDPPEVWRSYYRKRLVNMPDADAAAKWLALANIDEKQSLETALTNEIERRKRIRAGTVPLSEVIAQTRAGNGEPEEA